MIKIVFYYRDTLTNAWGDTEGGQDTKFSITWNRKWTHNFVHRYKEAYEDFIYYCRVNERLIEAHKLTNRYYKIEMYSNGECVARREWQF